MRSLILLTASLASFAACSPYDPELGSIPYKCAAEEPRCPDDYACQDNGAGVQLCVNTAGVTIDAAGSGSGSGFQCADDSVLEGPTKNDTIDHAYATPVAIQRDDISFAGVAICPEGDRDTFLVNIDTALSDLEATTSWDSGQPISVVILGAGGSMLSNSMPNGETSQKAFAANLPTGPYYVQAYGAASTKNNYRIAIKVTP